MIWGSLPKFLHTCIMLQESSEEVQNLQVNRKHSPQPCKKKTAVLITDSTNWNTYLQYNYHLVRKLSLAAWTFKQQPFHFELLNSETPADWKKKAKDSYIQSIPYFSLHKLHYISDTLKFCNFSETVHVFCEASFKQFQ